MASFSMATQRSKQLGLDFTFHPVSHDGSIIMDVKKDGMGYLAKKTVADFFFFHSSVLDRTSHMISKFPDVPVLGDSTSTMKFLMDLKIWFREYLTEGPLFDHQEFVLTSTFFEVDKNLGVNRTPVLTERIDLTQRLASGSGIRKMGYMAKYGGDKKGTSGNWKRRYFVLEDDLEYFENEAAYLAGLPPKGKIVLNAYRVIPRVNSDQRDSTNLEFEFTIHALPLSLTCRAENELEMQSWIDTINSLQLLCGGSVF
jgi:hypothetical protein